MRTDVTVDEWIAALESGRYRKARGSLRMSTPKGGFRHCCLGVLCELAGTTWLDDYNRDVESSVTIVNPAQFGPEIARVVRDTGTLAGLNDDVYGEDFDNYAAVIKLLLRWQEGVA